jgi:hypothetical protein
MDAVPFPARSLRRSTRCSSAPTAEEGFSRGASIAATPLRSLKVGHRRQSASAQAARLLPRMRSTSSVDQEGRSDRRVHRRGGKKRDIAAGREGRGRRATRGAQAPRVRRARDRTRAQDMASGQGQGRTGLARSRGAEDSRAGLAARVPRAAFLAAGFSRKRVASPVVSSPAELTVSDARILGPASAVGFAYVENLGPTAHPRGAPPHPRRKPNT